MSDNTLHRYRFLSGFCFDLVELDLYCYPWLPCHPKRVRVALVSIRKKNAAITTLSMMHLIGQSKRSNKPILTIMDSMFAQIA